jgi:hypothetical protein
VKNEEKGKITFCLFLALVVPCFGHSWMDYSELPYNNKS